MAAAAAASAAAAAGYPFFRPLPAAVHGSADVERTAFGDREWHCAGFLHSGPVRVLVCMGGWVDADATQEVIAFPVTAGGADAPAASWFVCCESPIAARAGASLVPLLDATGQETGRLLLFGGLDIGDSYSAVNDLHIVSLVLQSPHPRVVFEKVELFRGGGDGSSPGAAAAADEGESGPADVACPSPRLRHGACAVAGGQGQPVMFVFGGEDDESKVLGDAWFLFLVDSATEGSTGKCAKMAVWRHLPLSVVPEQIAPRAAATVFLVDGQRSNNDNDSTSKNEGGAHLHLAIVGGLTYPRDGEQASLQQSYIVHVKRSDVDLASDKVPRGIISPLRARMTPGDDALVPFPPFAVNTMLHAPLARERQLLLFGGKDTSRGCDDLFFCTPRAMTGTAATTAVGGGIFFDVSVAKCPFKETVAVQVAGSRNNLGADRAAADEQRNDDDDGDTDSDAEVEASLSVLKRTAKDSAWPHWRYAAAVAVCPAASGGTRVFCIGGTARHPDPGAECVVLNA